MKELLYAVLDKNGSEIPYYTGGRRTFEKAQKMCESLNKHGEFAPYSIVEESFLLENPESVKLLIELTKSEIF